MNEDACEVIITYSWQCVYAVCIYNACRSIYVYVTALRACNQSVLQIIL